MKVKLIIFIVVAVVIASVGVWIWQNKATSPLPSSGPQAVSPTKESQQASAPAASAGLGTKLFERTQNPLKDKLPQTNPFVGNETNPLKNVIKNPF